MKTIYYNIRVVKAVTKKKGWKKVQNNEFLEANALCDELYTKEELIEMLNKK